VFRFFRLLLAGAVALALLAGCGRKGALEPPPSASLSQGEANAQPGLGEEQPPGLFPGESARRSKPPPAPPPPSKPFILDWLLQ
jgi:predicted small lipoprotein YifL